MQGINTNQLGGPPQSQQVAESLGRSLEILGSAITRLEGVADRNLGETPNRTQPAGMEPVPAGQLRQLQSVAASLATRAACVADRLEQIG